MKISLTYLLTAVVTGAILLFVQWLLYGTPWAAGTEILFAPGFFAAALLVYGGAHSTAPYLFFFIASLLNGAIYGLPLTALWRYLCKRNKQANTGE